MSSPVTLDEVVRARAALVSLAVGDALGAAVEGMSSERAEQVVASELLPAAPADHPFWPGQRGGTTTDDTAQSILLAQRLLTDGPVIDSWMWTDDLAEWVQAEDAAGRGAHIGPSTRVAVLNRASDGTGSPGTTNGSTMRVVPLGIALAHRPDLLVEAVVAAGRPAHDSDIAHAASTAVACVIARGVAGADLEASIKEALARAREASAFGFRTGKRPFVDTLRSTLRQIWRAADAPLGERFAVLRQVAQSTGTGVGADESVVVAFAVALLERDDPWTAARLGASLGGDADSIAGLAAAMVAATSGRQPPAAVRSALDATEPGLVARLEDLGELLLRVT